MSDITEKKRADDELQSAQAHLMQLEKLHSIGQLAAGVAHEVKNPLQIILLGLQYLTDSAAAREPQAQSVIAEMNDAVRRASCVVQDLLDFSSPRELGMQRCPINGLIEKSLRFVRHDLKTAHVQVVQNLDPELPDALAEPNKMEQVFVNLMTNASHAMPQGGTLLVATRTKTITPADFAPHEAGDRIGSSFHAGEKAIVVEIRDTGTGVPPAMLARIFEPFYTTKSTGKGTGLGLSVTQKIMDLHRGKISIENHPEGGVMATLLLKPAGLETGKTKERT